MSVYKGRKIVVEGVTYEYSVGRYSTFIEGFGYFNNGQIGTCVDVSMDTYRVTPKDIENQILIELLLDARSKRFERIPREKKEVKLDPGPRTNGFVEMIGAAGVERVERVEDRIYLHMQCGSTFCISSENGVPRCVQTGLPDPDYS